MFLGKRLLKGVGVVIVRFSLLIFTGLWRLGKKIMERVGDFFVLNFEDIAFTLTATQLIFFC
jgi:hypothetical protein